MLLEGIETEKAPPISKVHEHPLRNGAAEYIDRNEEEVDDVLR